MYEGRTFKEKLSKFSYCETWTLLHKHIAKLQASEASEVKDFYYEVKGYILKHTKLYGQISCYNPTESNKCVQTGLQGPR